MSLRFLHLIQILRISTTESTNNGRLTKFRMLMEISEVPVIALYLALLYNERKTFLFGCIEVLVTLA